MLVPPSTTETTRHQSNLGALRLVQLRSEGGVVWIEIIVLIAYGGHLVLPKGIRLAKVMQVARSFPSKHMFGKLI